jgi:hypothetical protein
MLMAVYQTTRRHVPGGLNPYSRHFEKQNFKIFVAAISGFYSRFPIVLNPTGLRAVFLTFYDLGGGGQREEVFYIKTFPVAEIVWHRITGGMIVTEENRSTS